MVKAKREQKARLESEVGRGTLTGLFVEKLNGSGLGALVGSLTGGSTEAGLTVGNGIEATGAGAGVV